MTTILIGHRQTGAGDIAIKNGKHRSQTKKAGGGGGGGGGAAPVAPDGVEVSDEVALKGTAYETRLRTYDFNSGGDDITVRFTTKKSGSTEVEFQVNGSLSTAGGAGKNAVAIQNKISSIFRADIASRPNGAKYNTSAWKGDGRGGFREAMYARAGFSLGGGVKSDVGGGQYGIVRNGQLIPSTSTGKPFTAAQQKAHKTATRQALVEGLRQAKAGR
jgi:hypothetical protein